MSARNYELETNRSGYWEARWSEKQPNGKYRSKSWSTGHKDKAAAYIAADTFFQTAQTIADAKASHTMEDIAKAYLKSAGARGVGATQSFSLRVALRFFGTFAPQEITHKVVQEYVDLRREDEISDGTIRRDLGAIVAALNYGVRTRMFDRADMPFVDLPPDSPPREVWLNEAEEAEFWNLAIAHSQGRNRLSRLTRFVCIALETAARTEAIEDLEWSRVDFTANRIDFNVPGRRQTKKRRAVVPISARLRPILERAYAERTGPFVIDEGAIRTTFENFVASTGKYAHIQKHDLRRTWATLTARAGGDLYSIAGMLADRMETVMKHYAKHHPDHLKGVVDIRNTTPTLKKVSGGKP